MDESTALSSPFIQELLAGADKGNKESAEELALHGTAGALGTAPWLFGYGEESKSLSQADIHRRLLEKQWDEVLKQHRERPSPLMRLADFGAHVAVPLYTVITNWDELSTGDKAIYGALDGLFLAWLAKTPARIAFRVAASEGTASARAAAGSAARTRQVVEATFRTRLGEISPSLVGPADDTIRAQRNLANVMVMLDEAERYSALMARRARTARGEVAPGAQEAARAAQAEIPRALEAVQLARQDLLSAAKKYVKTWEGAAKGVGVDDPSIMKGLDRLPQQMVTDTQRVVDATLDRSPAMARAETRARRTIRDLDELTRQVGETKMALDEMTTGLGHTPIRAAKYARELNTRLESTLTEAVKLANELSPHLESVLAQANKQAARHNDRFKALYKKTEALEPTVEIYADLTELKARAAALSTGSYRLFEDATGGLRRLVTGFPEDRASWTQAMRQADEILATTRRQRNSARDSLEVLARGGPDWTPGSLASGPPAPPSYSVTSGLSSSPARGGGAGRTPRGAGPGTGTPPGTAPQLSRAAPLKPATIPPALAPQAARALSIEPETTLPSPATTETMPKPDTVTMPRPTGEPGDRPDKPGPFVVPLGVPGGKPVIDPVDVPEDRPDKPGPSVVPLGVPGGKPVIDPVDVPGDRPDKPGPSGVPGGKPADPDTSGDPIIGPVDVPEDRPDKPDSFGDPAPEPEVIIPPGQPDEPDPFGELKPVPATAVKTEPTTGTELAPEKEPTPPPTTPGRPPAAPKTIRVPPRRQGRRLLPRTAGGGTGLSKRMRKDPGRLFPHLVTWKQGKLWKLHDLDTGRTTTRATRPMGARTVKPGPALS